MMSLKRLSNIELIIYSAAVPNAAGYATLREIEGSDNTELSLVVQKLITVYRSPQVNSQHREDHKDHEDCRLYKAYSCTKSYG